MSLKNKLDWIGICLILSLAILANCATASNAETINWYKSTSNALDPARGGASVVFQNKLWVLGGESATGQYLNDVWSSSDGVNWTQVTPAAPWAPRGGDHTAVVFDNKIWIMGGSLQPNDYSNKANDVWYSSDGINWTQATASANWPKRYAHTSVVFQDKMWVIGGGSNGGGWLNDVWYSTDGTNWTQATSSAAWCPRYCHASVVYDNKIWVLGGNYASGQETKDVWYSSDGSTWQLATDNAPWGPRSFTAVVSYNNEMLLLGGLSHSGSYTTKNDVWSSQNGVDWVQVNCPTIWHERYCHRANVWNDSIWVLGGGASYAGNLLNDVWSSSNAVTIAATGADYPNQLIKTVPVGNRPEYLYGGTNNLYVNNWGTTKDGTISIIDLATLEETERITSPADNHAQFVVTPNERYLYMSNYYTGTISKIDLTTLGEVNSINTGGMGSWPNTIKISPDKQYIYVKEGSGDTKSTEYLKKIRLSDDSIVDSHDFPSEIADFEITPDGSHIWATTQQAVDALYYISTSPLNLVQQIAVPGIKPFPIKLTPDGSEIWIGYFNSDFISIFNTTTKTEVARFPINTFHANSIQFSPDGKYAFVGYDELQDITHITVIDRAARIAIEHISTGSGPYNTLLSSDGQYLYVTNCDDDTISVFTKKEVTGQTLAVGIDISNSQKVWRVGDRIDFEATVSGNTGGITYKWDLDGDGEYDDAEGRTCSRIYSQALCYKVGIMVKDAVSRAYAHLYLTIEKPDVTNEPPTFGTIDPISGEYLYYPEESKKQNGLIIITHGLGDAASDTWLSTMGTEIVNRIKKEKGEAAVPNICLYDWKERANPMSFLWGVECAPDNWACLLANVLQIKKFGGIPSGILLSNWLKQQIDNGGVAPSAPIHIIGHSAGGFVAGECAVILPQYITQITTLDTPDPDRSPHTDYPASGGFVDRYISEFAWYAPSLILLHTGSHYYVSDIEDICDGPGYEGQEYPDTGLIGDHDDAYRWYKDTCKSDTEDGFYYSPWLGHHPFPETKAMTARAYRETTSEETIEGFETFGNVNVSNSVYTITEGNGNAGIFKTIDFPQNTLQVTFKYQFTSAGDGDFLSVYMGEDKLLYIGPDLPITRNNSIDGELDVSDMAGKTGQLIFKLVSRGSTNAVLSIDSIKLVTEEEPVCGDGICNGAETCSSCPGDCGSCGDGGNGGGGGGGGGGCFIATACFGTPMADEVKVLSEFRDECLLTNPVGKVFVNTYYKISPPIADFIREHPLLKSVIRKMLRPLIWLAREYEN